ncbi:ARM repeat-containing protein [Coemansia reversa NRRL 1564]|uniref:Vacuolar protein 8 n=1 Tax=Coemansia reversa (strain ATCC 12441 / NRRL 1564) TaxID=763665 RepID=A0A2G5BJG0_COERN|nr:ARM repeat-containing protein [Coemansia reversa NRRL 1564]|eukprot:PIA19139.1 ARM repeat-containing protein [Coemansia reversa NRRL 1564]
MCCGSKAAGTGERQRLVDRHERERQAVAELAELFETDRRISFYEGPALAALAVLAQSESAQLQHTAATAFSEVSEYDVRATGAEALGVMVGLLAAEQAETRQAAATALGNLATHAANRRAIVAAGGLAGLVRQLRAAAAGGGVGVAAVGCVTNLAADAENKEAVARSGAVEPLALLAQSRDARVQRNAAGALLNLTHGAEARAAVAAGGAVAALAALTDARDAETQHYALTALGNVAVDACGRDALWATPALPERLVLALRGRAQAAAARALRNLASDERFQAALVRAGALDALRPLLRASSSGLVAAAAACVRNLALHADNAAAVAEMAPELLPLVTKHAQPDAQCHAVAALRNAAVAAPAAAQSLAAAGLFACLDTALAATTTQPPTLAELAAALGAFALSDSLWRPVVELGLCARLVRLARAPPGPAARGACLALASLAARREPEVLEELLRLWRRGLRDCLAHALARPEHADQRAAVLWLARALLLSKRTDARRAVATDPELVAAIEALATPIGSRDPAPPVSLSDDDAAGEGDAPRVRALALQVVAAVQTAA